MFDLHTVAMPDGAGPQTPDRLIFASFLALSIAPSANTLTALGAITAGTGYTSIPTLAPSGGTLNGAGAKPAVARVTSLKVVSSTNPSPGAGYAANDTIQLGNGVVVTVSTVTAGAIATYTVSNAGAFTGPGAVPTNPVAQQSTSGSGTGATFNLTWGVGAAIIDDSGNYTAAPGFAVTSVDGNGSGASIAGGTLGGAGTPAFVQAGPLAEGIGPTTSTIGATSSYTTLAGGVAAPDQDAVCSINEVQPSFISFRIVPRLAANSLVAGIVRALLWA